MNGIGTLNSIMERKDDNYEFWGLLMSFESIMDFTKKIPSLLSLIASIVFNDTIGVEHYIYQT